MIVRARAAFALAPVAVAVFAACSGPSSTTPTDVYLAPSSSGSVAAASGSAKPAAGKATIKRCSSGPEKCAANEVCCRAAAGDKAVVEYCAAFLTEPEEARDNSLAACGAVIPEEAKSGDFSVDLTALACVDSGDCKADEICISGAFYSSDSTASKCMPKKGAYGLDELCGRGTCKLGKTACSKAPPSTSKVYDLQTCEPTAPVVCGKAACKAGEVCVGNDKGVKCGPPPADLSQGAVLACTADAQCAESQVCCLVGAGMMGSHCAFGCDIAMERYFCNSDADCKNVAPEGMTFKCKPEPEPPLKGAKTCQ